MDEQQHNAIELPKGLYESVLRQPMELDFLLGQELSLCFHDLDGSHVFKTCYGDICKAVNALRDYARLLEMACEQWDLTGFHRALYEYHAEKMREIAGKFQAGIGYDYDAAMEKCRRKRKRKKKEDDFGEDALVLAFKRTKQPAEQMKEADMYDVHSVRFQFVYTEERKKANRRAHTAADEGQALVMAAEVRNSIMEPVMDAIAQNFVCYQYEDTEPAPFGSCQWDLFFWCNDFSNTLNGYGLSGRDYSYFTLSFNEKHTVEKRAEVCWRLLQFLEHSCRKNRNLDVAVQHSIWYDHEKIEKDADRMKCLLAGCSCTYGSKDGKFLFDDGIFCFRPKYAKRQLYRVSDSEVLALCWKLGLTDDAADGSPLATGRHSA